MVMMVWKMTGRWGLVLGLVGVLCFVVGAAEVERNSTLAQNLAYELAHGTCSKVLFTCHDIGELTLDHYHSHSVYRLSFITHLDGHPLILRFGERKVRFTAERTFEVKRRAFLEEWLKASDTKLCHRGLNRLFGTCNTAEMVADVGELLYDFDTVRAVMDMGGSDGYWCWGLKWLDDVVREFAFMSEQHELIKPHTYINIHEFGVNVDGVLKQPDFGRIPKDHTGDVWSYCNCPRPPCPHCDKLLAIKSWFQRECADVSRNECNLTNISSMEKLLFNVILKTVGVELLKLKPMAHFGGLRKIADDLFPDTYALAPTPKHVRFVLNAIFNQYRVNECAQNTLPSLMAKLNTHLFADRPLTDGAEIAAFITAIKGMALKDVMRYENLDPGTLYLQSDPVLPDFY